MENALTLKTEELLNETEELNTKINNNYAKISTGFIAGTINGFSLLGGMPVATSTRKNIVWGNLSLNDPETGLVMRANHPTMQHYMQTLEPGQELEGFRMSENPCMDMKTGEATNIMWVEAY